MLYNYMFSTYNCSKLNILMDKFAYNISLYNLQITNGDFKEAFEY